MYEAWRIIFFENYRILYINDFIRMLCIFLSLSYKYTNKMKYMKWGNLMSEEKKVIELTDEDLEKVSGGTVVTVNLFY